MIECECIMKGTWSVKDFVNYTQVRNLKVFL